MARLRDSLADADVGLKAQLSNARALQDAVQVLAGAGARTADLQVRGCPRGLFLGTCVHGSYLASVVVPKAKFATYVDEGLVVRVNLSLLADCLAAPPATAPPWSSRGGQGATGGRDALQLARPGEVTLSAAPDMLSVLLVEEHSTSDSTLRTVEGDDDALETLRKLQGTIVASTIVKSDALRDTLAELEYGGGDTMAFRLSNEEPRIVFAAPPGARPAIQVEFPDPDEPMQETVTEFFCAKPVAAAYRLETLKKMGRALAASEFAKLALDDDGVLAVFCQMKEGAALTNCFVEFVFVAQEAEGENDGSGDEQGGSGAAAQNDETVPEMQPGLEEEEEEGQDEPDEEEDDDTGFW